MAAWSKSSRRRTSTSARSASRAAATSVKASASARKSERASSVTTRTRSVSSPAWVLASHQARYAATVSGRRPASSSAATSAGAGTRASLWTRPGFAAVARGHLARVHVDAAQMRDETTGTLGRVGWLATAALYALLSLLAIRLAVEGSTGGHRPDAEGALQLVAEQPLSQGLLVLLMLGFAAHRSGGWPRRSVTANTQVTVPRGS